MDFLTSLYNFWHAHGPDIQNGAVVLSAIAAFVVIRSTKISAKRRNTLDVIFNQESDRELIDARIDFNKLKVEPTKLSHYAETAQKTSAQFQNIRKVLNIHELTAVAILEGVIDECVYRSWFNTTYISDYEATKDFIKTARKTFGNEAAFVKFEETALRWKNDNNWPKRPNIFARKFKAIGQVWRA